MVESIKKFFEKDGELDLKKLALVAGSFFALTIILLLANRSVDTGRAARKRFEMQGLSRRSAFKLTAKKSSSSSRDASSGSNSASKVRHAAGTGPSGTVFGLSRNVGIDTRGSGLGVQSNVEAIENQLSAIEEKMNNQKKIRNYPPGADRDRRDMIDAENDDDYLDAISCLEAGNLDEAEKLYKQLIDKASGNKFKELYGWGGLMEVYQRKENKAKYKDAFARYAQKAQELKHIYGSMADSIGAAYNTFGLVEKADPGKLREELTKYNLANGTNIQPDDLINSMRDTQSWFPSNIQMSDNYKKAFNQQGR